MGRALSHLSELWDEVTEDFLTGKPTNVRSPLDAYFRSYARTNDVDLEGFCEPFLGPINQKPKIAFLSLNPGEVQPEWQHLNWNGDGGEFVKQIRQIGSYRKWAASWPYLQPPWQAYIKKKKGPNHHLNRFRFMQAWCDNAALTPEDRVDFELYPWHSRNFDSNALKLDKALLREFVWDPLAELGAPIVFAFGQWWWQNLRRLDVEIIAELGVGTDHPIELGHKIGAAQGIVIAVAPYGGMVIAEKHSGSAGPPALDKVPMFRKMIVDASGRHYRA